MVLTIGAGAAASTEDASARPDAASSSLQSCTSVGQFTAVLGDDESGQRGNGTSGSGIKSNVPVKGINPSGVAGIAAGGHHGLVK